MKYSLKKKKAKNENLGVNWKNKSERGLELIKRSVEKKKWIQPSLVQAGKTMRNRKYKL